MSWDHVNRNPETVAANAARLRGFATKPEFAEMRRQRVIAGNKKTSSLRMHALNQRSDFKTHQAEHVRRLNSDPIIIARRLSHARHKKCKGIKCPAWVPEELQDEFFQWAKLFGEYEAAKHIRNLKREMKRLYV